MTRKTRIRIWIATIVLGVLMIPIGVGWIIYTVTQTGQYAPTRSSPTRTPTSPRAVRT